MPRNNAKTLPKKTELRADIKSVQSEIHKYDLAVEQVKTFLDPERSVSKLPRYTGSEPVTYFQPRSKFYLSVPDAGTPFSIHVSPDLYDPILITDRSRPGDSLYIAQRNFAGTEDNVDLDSLSPPGRFETDAYLACRHPINQQINFVSNRGSSQNWGYYDTDIGYYVNNFGGQLIGPGAEPAFVTSMLCSRTAGGLAQTLNFRTNTGIYSVAATGTLVTDLQLRWTATITNATYGGQELYEVWLTYAAVGTALMVKQATFSVNFGSDLIPNDYLLHRLPISSEVATQVEDISNSYETLGLDIWVEYQGSTLTNGGTIAGYRFPHDYHFDAPVTKWYEQMGTIPKSYSGALRDGCYGFYLPARAQDMSPRPIHDKTRGPVLVVSGIVDDPSVRLQVTVRQVVRATTISPIFKPMYPPSCVDAIEASLNYLQQSPSFMCNPSHLQNIKRAWAYLDSHKDKIKSGAHSVVSIGKILAPLIATALA